MGHKAKWEYFREVYERYREAGREAKQVMLNEFCLHTGYHRKSAIRLSERTSSWKASGAAIPRTTAALWPASALHLGGDLGSGWISLVGAAEGFAAQLDALDSQALPDDPALGFYSLQRQAASPQFTSWSDSEGAYWDTEDPFHYVRLQQRIHAKGKTHDLLLSEPKTTRLGRLKELKVDSHD